MIVDEELYCHAIAVPESIYIDFNAYDVCLDGKRVRIMRPKSTWD